MEAQALVALTNGRIAGARGCVAAAEAAGRTLDATGIERPTWDALLGGARPPRPDPDDDAEAGEWKRGWQFFACS